MKKCGFIVLVLLALITVARANVTSEKRPNILWILIEDWSPDLSCYGTKAIHTPHIDQLAAEGLLFEKAFVNAPVCSTSRSSLMTGYDQYTIGAPHHRTPNRKPLPPDIRPIPLLLKDAGYYTCILKNTKTDLNFTDPTGKRYDHTNLFDGSDWSARKPNQPFFAQLTIGSTHRSWRRDPKRPIDEKNVELPPYYPDTPFIRRDWANGLEQMQEADRSVGNILQRLEQEGLEKNTLVIFMSDHGRCHIRGKQFLYDPGLHVPLILRWPGQIAPGKRNSDLVSSLDICKTLLDLAEIEPQRPMPGLNLFNGETARRQELYFGRDMMGTAFDAMRAIRTPKYKLIHNLMPERAYCQYDNYKQTKYPPLALMKVFHAKGELTPAQAAFMADSKPEFELYDLQADPHEINNLANTPELADLQRKLLAKLNAWRKAVNDPGVTPEFRAGGKPDTLTTSEWEAILEKWKPWVFRPVHSKMEHPFPKKSRRRKQ